MSPVCQELRQGLEVWQKEAIGGLGESSFSGGGGLWSEEGLSSDSESK